jgi:CubicO group peptidase (beta-lactamase class C family)
MKAIFFQRIFNVILTITLLTVGCQKEETAKLATVTTKPITVLSPTSASSGGDISDDGGASVIARGVCWNTARNPNIETGTKTTDDNIKDTFTSSITGLKPGTNYYVRAYATNKAGTSYGNEVIFQAVEPISDIDNAIKAKMTQYNIPGLSLAIVKNEKLVYIRSYGFSDKENGILCSGDNLFRIASVSKVITAITILKLVQDNLISLDQKVFGSKGILGNDYGTPPVGSNIDSITVRHLFDHTSGWTNTPDDPLATNFYHTQSQLITGIVTNRPLTYTPGSTFYYLNIGYCILGRVIEKVTKMSYENYVKSNILLPCGITEMKIGGNTLEERFPNEVNYYQDAYNYVFWINVKRFDAAGGWIASATDLARFIVRIDRNSFVSDLIDPNLLNQFYFGNTSWGHTGGLAGTRTVLYRMNDTFSFVILTNTWDLYNGNDWLGDLYNELKSQINLISTWPTYDLFQR